MFSTKAATYFHIFTFSHFHNALSDFLLRTKKEFIESSLQTIDEIATEKLGTKCASKTFHTLQVPLNTARYEGTRQKADLTSIILQDVGLNHHGGMLNSLMRNQKLKAFDSQQKVKMLFSICFAAVR